jgi:hypothetical protein
MTNPIAESTGHGPPAPGAANGSLAPEGPSQSVGTGTEPTSSVADVFVSTEPEADEKSQPDDNRPPESGSTVADRQVAEVAGQPVEEEYPPVSPADGREDGPTGVARIDIRARYNRGQIIGQWFDAVQRHSGAPLSKRWVEDELKDYVPFGNEALAGELLDENHVLVLVADNAGSGRWTAALRLLSDPKRGLTTLRRIRRDPGDSFEIDGLRGRRTTGWILDLRDPDEDMPIKCDFGHELLQTDDLQADGSYLAVLVSAELWDRIGNGASGLELRIEPPDQAYLFTKLLKSSGIDRPEAWAEKFKSTIEQHHRPAQVREWANAVVSSYYEYEIKKDRPPTPEDSSEDIKKSAQNAVSSWMDELAGWHKKPGRTSYERNYLLLAAVYDGAPIEGVHNKVASLASKLGETGEAAKPLPGQQGPGLIQLAREIQNAELLPNGRLRFPGPGYAEAVVRYFWLDRPHLIDAFMKWTVQLSLELKHPQGSQLAERMAPWILHHAQVTSSTRPLRLVASEWSEDKDLAEHAHALLTAASLDPQLGSRVRKAMGAWVGQDGTSPALLQTLARVFQTLVPAHDQMLGRLGDLARSPKDGVAEAVGEAINDLWSDNKLRPLLSDTLISWFDSDQEVMKQAAVSTFLHLARRGLPTLLDEPAIGVPEWVVRGWRVVLEADKLSPLGGQAFMAWMDTAVLQEVWMELAISTLVRAVHDTPSDYRRGLRLLNLGRLTEQWRLQGGTVVDQVRAEISQELQHRIQLADPHRLRLLGQDGPTGA